jgi:hypothetical protein
MRREALPIRNELLRLVTGHNVIHDREHRLLYSTTKTTRPGRLPETTPRKKEQKADRKQNSAKAKKKRKGGRVRESMEKGKMIASNKEKWASMYV